MLSALRPEKSNRHIWLLAVHQRCSADVLTGYELKQSNPLTDKNRFGISARRRLEMPLMEEKWHGTKPLADLQHYSHIFNYRCLRRILRANAVYIFQNVRKRENYIVTTLCITLPLYV